MDRTSLIKLIHVARRELGLDEETYRTVLRTTGKAESTKEMDVPALMRVVEHLKRAGFKVRSSKPSVGKARPMTISPAASKVRALWLFLHHLGAVRDPSEAALATYVKRIAKVDDLRWLPGDKVDPLIESLKKWAMRYLPEAIKELRREVLALHLAKPLTPAQVSHVQSSDMALRAGEGFDKHWWAWEHLMEALGRPVQPAIRVLEAQPDGKRR